MSQSKKIIWFKKAKCAGTSFEAILEDHRAIYYVNEKTTREELDDPSNKVICIREALFPYGKTLVRNPGGEYKLRGKPRFVFDMRRHLMVPFLPRIFMLRRFPDFMRQNHKIAVVRNPYDKFISSWKYLKSTRDYSIEHVLKNMPKRRQFHDWVHLTQRQVDCIQDEIGNVIVDQIIYMEKNFEDEMNEIIDLLEISAKKMPFKNRSNRDPVSSYLSDNTAKEIYSYFQEDFLCFGYSQDFNELSPIFPNTAIGKVIQ